MNDLTPNTEPIILCNSGTDRQDVEIGGLHVHEFPVHTGIQRVWTPEHAIFRVNIPVTCTDVWQGQRQRQTTYDPGDLQFLPAGTDLSTVYLSRPYSETLIRIPHHLLEVAADGEIDLSSTDLHYFRIPRSECLGLYGAVRNLAQAKARGVLVRQQTEDLVTEAAVVALIDGITDHRRWGRQRPIARRNTNGIRRAIELVDDAIDQPVTLQQLAGAAAMSPYHFCRSFKAATGTTPMRYLWQRRLDRAKEMLAGRASSLADVAVACGFSSQSHMTRAFKQALGVTPRAYRRSMP